jgi:hypothetical protein
LFYISSELSIRAAVKPGAFVRTQLYEIVGCILSDRLVRLGCNFRISFSATEHNSAFCRGSFSNVGPWSAKFPCRRRLGDLNYGPFGTLAVQDGGRRKPIVLGKGLHSYGIGGETYVVSFVLLDLAFVGFAIWRYRKSRRLERTQPTVETETMAAA